MSPTKPKTTLGLAVIGAGTVGGGVLRLLREQQTLLQTRCGRKLEIVHIVKRNPNNILGLDKDLTALVSDDWQKAIADPRTDIVVELIGGKDTAADCIRAALNAGKPVVTANKALLAETAGSADDIIALGDAKQLPVMHEAAIAGCIPIVKTLREALAGDAVNEIYGVINGTCNYILTTMETDSLSFADALHNAQQAGYAEADPALDIDGGDAAHKLSLISRLAFAARPQMTDIPVAGVRDFNRRDIVYARQFNYRIKLLAIAKKTQDGTLELRVRPAMIPAHHLLASVEGATNAIVVRSAYAGETMFYGAGAGAHPTAVAVIADIIDIARSPSGGQVGTPSGGQVGNRLTQLPADNQHEEKRLCKHFIAPFYLRLRVLDRPGVLADVTRLLAKRDISIEAIHQNESAPQQKVDVVILLHASPDDQVADSAAEIEQLETVTEPVVIIPIERLSD